MSDQTNSTNTHNAISSQESVSGATPYAKQDGQTTDQCGQVAAHANLSPRQAKELGLLTSGTYGRLSYGCYNSHLLAWSLASKLAELAELKHGSPGPVTTCWDLGFGSRPSILKLELSRKIIRVLAPIGWPTPTTMGNQLAPSMRKHRSCRNLQDSHLGRVAPLSEIYRWLMGLPVCWTYAGVMAMQSSPRKRRRSSRHI